MPTISPHTLPRRFRRQIGIAAVLGVLADLALVATTASVQIATTGDVWPSLSGTIRAMGAAVDDGGKDTWTYIAAVIIGMVALVGLDGLRAGEGDARVELRNVVSLSSSFLAAASIGLYTLQLLGAAVDPGRTAGLITSTVIATSLTLGACATGSFYAASNARRLAWAKRDLIESRVLVRRLELPGTVSAPSNSFLVITAVCLAVALCAVPTLTAVWSTSDAVLDDLALVWFGSAISVACLFTAGAANLFIVPVLLRRLVSRTSTTLGVLLGSSFILISLGIAPAYAATLFLLLTGTAVWAIAATGRGSLRHLLQRAGQASAARRRHKAISAFAEIKREQGSIGSRH